MIMKSIDERDYSYVFVFKIGKKCCQIPSPAPTTKSVYSYRLLTSILTASLKKMLSV